MVGYCAIGRLKIDATPASIRMMAITQAKIGRSIKNFAMKQAPCYCAADADAAPDAAPAHGARGGRGGRGAGGLRTRRRLRGQLSCDRLHRHAGLRLFRALHDHAVARVQAAVDHPVARRSVPDVTSCATVDLVVRADHERQRLALLVVRDADLRHEHRIVVDAFLDPRAHEHARQQHAVLVREDRAHGDRARALVDASRR